MTDTIITLLQWLVPSGGLGAAVAWAFSRTLRSLRETKEVHDTYKSLYEDISETLKDLQNEVDDLQKELGRFRRAVARIYGCRHYSDCPVNRELQNSESGTVGGRKSGKNGGQPAVRDLGADSASGSGGEGGPGGSGGGAP